MKNPTAGDVKVFLIANKLYSANAGNEVGRCVPISVKVSMNEWLLFIEQSPTLSMALNFVNLARRIEKRMVMNLYELRTR
jgi:hypothetical protein